ncbi:MAG: glycerol-3-phosphate dehydrogenase/oxidase [Cytophagaceae bacterium]
MSTFSYKNRHNFIQKAKSETFDLVVIGGGITGAGIALDAQSRGMTVLLVEMQDFAAGTSSRSTKLVHGGLRYLKQLELKLVAEVGKERKIVYENAQHLTRPEPMLLPMVKGGTINTFAAFTGLWLYDTLAGVKGKERRKMLNKQEVFSEEPLLRKDLVYGGVKYYEYKTDDARLTLAILKEAVNRGAIALNYCKVSGFVYSGKIISGLQFFDTLTGNECTVKAKYIVNSSGPWVDATDDFDVNAKKNKLVHTKGVHLVFDHAKLPVKQSIYFDVPDKRMVFAIPRDGKTYLGTTDTFYHGDIKNPPVEKEDVIYLLNAINYIFPDLKLSERDVESSWAGLRPLIKEEGKAASAISRKDEVYVYPSGLITIAGGKLTGYRKMAEKVVDLVAKKLKSGYGKNTGKCSTQKIKLAGGDFEKFGGFIKGISYLKESGMELGLSEEKSEELAMRFGTDVKELFSVSKESLSLKEKYKLPDDILMQLMHCLEHEYVISPADFLVRRTGMLYFNISETEKYKDEICRFIFDYNSVPQHLQEIFSEDLCWQVNNASIKGIKPNF